MASFVLRSTVSLRLSLSLSLSLSLYLYLYLSLSLSPSLTLYLSLNISLSSFNRLWYTCYFTDLNSIRDGLSHCSRPSGLLFVLLLCVQKSCVQSTLVNNNNVFIIIVQSPNRPLSLPVFNGGLHGHVNNNNILVTEPPPLSPDRFL